jgi:hypothetical protein
MASNRKPRYPGALNQPIVRPLKNGLWGSKNGAEYIFGQREKKIELLFKHFGIKREDRLRWQKLAFYLAVNHVRGMQLIDRLAELGAPQKWDISRAKERVKIIDQIQSERGRGVKDAIQIAKRRGHLKGNEKAIEHRYRLSKKQIEKHARRTDELEQALPLAEAARRLLGAAQRK